MKTETPNDWSPKYHVDFNLRGSLARAMKPPVVVNDPIRLVIFGDSSTIYLAQVTDSAAVPYAPLKSIKATTYIHGWSVDRAEETVRLYFVDGVELCLWDLKEGKKLHGLNLLRDAEYTTATQSLTNLQKVTQRVEWAMLLDQAEDEWVKLTAERNAAEPGSAERDRLDQLTEDFLPVLRALRDTTGSSGSAASRTLVAELKTKLADARKTAAPYLFS